MILSFVLSCSASQKHHHSRSVKADVTEKKISKKELPAEVLKSFEEKYPSAKITGQLKETREGIAYYEIESIDSSRRRDLLFQVDGKIIEVEESISLHELPRFVQDSVRVKFPGATITSAERSTRDSHVEYELVLGDGKKTREVVVNSAGKVFKIK